MPLTETGKFYSREDLREAQAMFDSVLEQGKAEGRPTARLAGKDGKEHENLHTTFMRALFLAAREHGYDLEGGIQFMPTSEINRSGVIRIQTDLLLVPHMK